MATNFPASLDTLTNPVSGDSLASPSHAAQHANVNDAVEALQAKVGVDGSAVTSSLDYKVAQQGLTFIKSQTIGSGVSSVTVTGAFSSTFDNYRIQVTGGATGAPTAITLRVGSTTAGYYQAGQNVTYAATSSIGAVNNGNGWLYAGVGTTDSIVLNVDLLQPFLTRRTVIQNGYTYGSTSGGGDVGFYAGYVNNATSYTAFTILAGSGTMTGGTIRVYGYNNG